MSGFRSGDIVNITIKGARMVRADEDGLTADLTPGGPSTQVYLPWGPDLDVERVAPANWPPLPGDVWGMRGGGRYVCVRDLDIPGGGDVALINVRNGERYMPHELIPVELLYREDEKDEQDGGDQS